MFIIGHPDQDPFKLGEKEECEGFKILSNNIVFPRASFSWDRKHPLVVRRFKKWHKRVEEFKVPVPGSGVGYPGILTGPRGSAMVAV